MKKLIFILAMALTAPAMFAQSNVEEVDMIQSIFGMQKKEIYKGFVNVDGESADAFWSLYDAYESERKVLGKKRLDLLNAYANNYGSMNDEKLNSMTKEYMALKAANTKLVTKYYKKMNKEVNATAAAQFMQMEDYISSVTRLAIMENIPFIGELY